MAIIVRCDLCNAIIQTIDTSGVSDATTCIPDTEKICGDCTLTNRLADWPARLQEVKVSFVTGRMDELKDFFEASIRQKFVEYARQAAKAHFGPLYDSALPSIQDEVMALRDTPMTITVTFNQGT